jgi:hypothetical protein
MYDGSTITTCSFEKRNLNRQRWCGGDTSGADVVLGDQWYTKQRQLSTTLLELQSVTPLTPNLLFVCDYYPC